MLENLVYNSHFTFDSREVDPNSVFIALTTGDYMVIMITCNYMLVMIM